MLGIPILCFIIGRQTRLSLTLANAYNQDVGFSEDSRWLKEPLQYLNLEFPNWPHLLRTLDYICKLTHMHAGNTHAHTILLPFIILSFLNNENQESDFQSIGDFFKGAIQILFPGV